MLTGPLLYCFALREFSFTVSWGRWIFVRANDKQKKNKLHLETLWDTLIQQAVADFCDAAKCEQDQKLLPFYCFACLFFKLSPTSVVLPTASQIQQRFSCLSDKDLKIHNLTARRSKTSFFFSQKVNRANSTLLLLVDVSNNIPKSKRTVCRDYHWTNFY